MADVMHGDVARRKHSPAQRNTLFMPASRRASKADNMQDLYSWEQGPIRFVFVWVVVEGSMEGVCTASLFCPGRVGPCWVGDVTSAGCH